MRTPRTAQTMDFNRTLPWLVIGAVAAAGLYYLFGQPPTVEVIGRPDAPISRTQPETPAAAEPVPEELAPSGMAPSMASSPAAKGGRLKSSTP
jgi:hypothetical protein